MTVFGSLLLGKEVTYLKTQQIVYCPTLNLL